MKLQRDKNQIVEFQIEVEGTNEKINPRLLLHNESISVMFPGKMNGKNAIFEVTQLDKIFGSNKTINGEIEVIVEGRYFKPWISEIEIEAPVQIRITESSAKIQEPTVRVVEKTEKRKPKIGQQKIKIAGVLHEVYVTGVTEKNGKTHLDIVDENGKNRKIKLA